MAEAAYPLLRRRRTRRLRLPRWATARHLRLAAFGVLLVAALGIAALALRRPAPIDPLAAYAEGQRAMARGNYSAARNHALEALSRRPHSAAAQLLLASAYLALADGVAAEAALTRAADLGAPAARLHGPLARARWLEGDADGALIEADAAPTDPLAVRTRARILAARGHADRANALLGSLADAIPRQAGIFTDLGRIRLSAGDVGGAAMAAQRGIALAPRDPAALTLQAEVIRTRYGLAAALPWFETALRSDAYYHPALIEYAATLGDAGRYTDMLAATRKALAARPGSSQALYLQAVLAARGGRRTLAGDLLARAGGPSLGPGAMLLRAGLDHAAGRYEQAIDGWRQLVAVQPTNVAARRLLGAALLASGDAAGALDVLRPIAARADADTYALTLVARAFEASGDRVAAARFADRAAAAHGASTAFDTDSAASTYAADMAAAPDDPNYVVGLIRAYLTAGNTAAAIERARTLATAAPGAPAAQIALGDALMQGGRIGEAFAAYARAADLDFDEPAMLRLVDALGRAGKPRDAAATLALYLRQNPQSIAGQRLRAHWQVAAGQGAAAIETLERLRATIGNRDVGLLTDLALAYAAADDGAVARRYGAAAYRLLPMSAAVSDAYGLALAADQDVDGARQLFAKAAALDPGNATIAAHLAQIRR